LPSGKLATNNLVLHCALVAYNILRAMGQGVVQDPAVPLRSVGQRRRIRTVIRNLVYLAARLMTHARQVWLRFGRGNCWGTVVRRLYAAFA
jgi:hypothetical protein